jgi:hypothetical protein
MSLKKQFLISFCGGVLLFCVWIAIGVVTSQDFDHEGPNSIWFSPIDAWSSYLGNIVWWRRFCSMFPNFKFLFQVAAILGPFVVTLSSVVHLAVWMLRKTRAARKIS